MNSRCPKDEVFLDKFRIGLARGKPMVVRRCVQSSFGQRENLGCVQHFFVNDLVGFPSCKKIKAIYEGIKSREYQGVTRNARKY